MTQPIAILSAIPQELTLLRAESTVSKESDLAGRRAHAGTLDGYEVVLTEAGVGKVNTAVTAGLAVERFSPRLLLFSGVAGGLDPDLHIGDIVVAEHLIQHDAGMIEAGGLAPYQPGHVPFFNPSDRLGYPTEPELLIRVMNRLADLALEPVAGGDPPRVVSGTVLSGDQFLNDGAIREQLHEEFGGLAIEMEGGALAQAAEQLSVEHLVIRALSDLAGGASSYDFTRFLDEVTVNLVRVVRHLLPVL